MTYCVAMSLDAGMIFASDSRTNAGVDQVGRFSKRRVFSREGDRVIVEVSPYDLDRGRINFRHKDVSRPMGSPPTRRQQTMRRR